MYKKRNIMIYVTMIIWGLILSCSEKPQSEIHLIPKNYKGPVIIIFGDLNGENELYENGKRVYRIPSNGILRTKFKTQEEGFISPGGINYYYYDGSDRTPLPYLLQIDGIKDDGRDYVFGKELSQNTDRYLVGRLKDQDSYFKSLRNKIDELFPPKVQ
jgi:hypothetical protein